MNHLYNPNRRKFPVLIPVAIILASALTLFCVPQIIQAERFEDEELRVNRERIENMSKIERDRLKRKFDNYQNFSAAEKKTFQILHEALNEDRKKGGTLNDVMQNYDNWLLTLTPRQLDAIKSSTNDENRKKRVDEYLNSQEEQRNSRKSGFRNYISLRKSKFHKSFSSTQVSKKMKLTMIDVYEISRQLEKEMKIEIKINQLSSADKKYLAVLSHVLKTHQKRQQQKKTGYIDDASIVTILEKSNADPNFIGRIKSSAENTDGNYDVLKAMMATLFDDFRRQYQNRKENYLATLPKSTQIEIRTRSPLQQKIRLEWQFHRDNPEYFTLIRTYYLNFVRSMKSFRGNNQQENRSRSGKKKSKRSLFR